MLDLLFNPTRTEVAASIRELASQTLAVALALQAKGLLTAEEYRIAKIEALDLIEKEAERAREQHERELFEKYPYLTKAAGTHHEPKDQPDAKPV